MKKFLLITFLFAGYSAISYGSISLSALRNMYTGTAVVLPSGTVIEGTVISNQADSNTQRNNAIIQDATGGICVRFDVMHSFAMGDDLSIDVSGDSLNEFNGLLQVNHVPLANATILGTSTVTPPVVTISAILSNMNGTTDTWESTLLTINNVIISSFDGIYSGGDTITDATGLMILFVRSAATFASSSLPTGTVNITGFISDFNEPEFIIRNLNDVQVSSSIKENITATPSYIVSPNPAHDQVKISSTGVSGVAASYKITDAAGRIYDSGSIHFNQVTGDASLNVNDIKPGIYFLWLEADSKVQPVKIVVE